MRDRLVQISCLISCLFSVTETFGRLQAHIKWLRCIQHYMTSFSKDSLICIISVWQGHNSPYIFEDRGKRTCSPFFVPVELEQTCDHAVEGLPLFRADMNQTWNGLDKVIVILIPGGVRPIDSAEHWGKAERLRFSVKSWGNISIWCMNNLDGSSWFLLLLC